MRDGTGAGWWKGQVMIGKARGHRQSGRVTMDPYALQFSWAPHSFDKPRMVDPS